MATNKARYWNGVLYPENMIDGWQDKVADLIQIPFAYCVHDADNNTDGEERKTHVHFLIAFPNTTTYAHALSVFKLLGEKAINTCQAAVSVRKSYDYLIHDTDTCRKDGKHQYSPSDRITGNNFDIGCYEQVSVADRQKMLKELADYITDYAIENLIDLYVAVTTEFPEEYFAVFVSYNALLERMTKAAFFKSEAARQEAKACAVSRNGDRRGDAEEQEAVDDAEHQEDRDGDIHAEQHETNAHIHENDLQQHENDLQQHENDLQQHGVFCPRCGSINLKRNGKTASDLQRYLCKECGGSFSF